MRAFLAILMASSAVSPVGARTLDHVSLASGKEGDANRLKVNGGRVAAGGLGQAALFLEPAADKGWRGGTVEFYLAVAETGPTFLSLRMWGGDVATGNLTLICGGKQVGDRLLSDYDQLDYGSHSPQFPGAFFYRTYRLPDAVTKGRSTIDCRIEASGPIFPYGETFDKFQKAMTAPSRGIYDVFTHDDAWLVPVGMSDGFVATPAPRGGSGKIAANLPEGRVLGDVKKHLENSVSGLLTATRPLGQHEIAFLAHFRHKTWSPLAKDPRIVPAIVKGIDQFAESFANNPDLVKFEKTTWNPDWFGFGPIGEALASDPAAFRPLLDQRIRGRGGAMVSRRDAYTAMLLASREWLRTHRRFYTNQSMIVDCYGIYLANRGLGVVAPDKAMPEDEARRYLYESIGLEEWRGDDEPNGGHSYDAGGPDGTKAAAYQVARGYHLVTKKGLTRELGYVGNYGEVQDWVANIYNATRPSWNQPGDPRILEQLAKIARARAPFRYPAVDDEGHSAMRMMADVGWRDLKAPGEVAYVQVARNGSASPIQAAVLTGDGDLVGYAQQMVSDNQLFPKIAEMNAASGFRAVYGLLDVIDDVAALGRMPQQQARLPMTDGQPDFAFADPQDAVVAVKRGNERLYASLWWRSNFGVTGLGRVWLSGPRGNHIATVPVKTGYTPSGQVYTRPDKVVLLKNGEVNRSYGLSLAEAGETLPMTKAPDGIALTPGRDSIYAGRGDNFVMTYGGYTIAINMSDTKGFDFLVPPHDGNELTRGQAIAAGTTLKMPPQSTVVFYSGK